MNRKLLWVLLIVVGFVLSWTLVDGAYRNTGWWMRILVLLLLFIFTGVKLSFKKKSKSKSQRR